MNENPSQIYYKGQVLRVRIAQVIQPSTGSEVGDVQGGLVLSLLTSLAVAAVAASKARKDKAEAATSAHDSSRPDLIDSQQTGIPEIIEA